MKVHADTSFLVSLYTPDANSAKAAAQLSQTKAVVLLTPLSEVELTNALELRIFRKEISRAEADAARSAFQQDVGDNVFSVVPAPSGAYAKAQQLSRKHTAAQGLRTLDILHVAAALALGADRFCSFDARQRKLAASEGLATN